MDIRGNLRGFLEGEVSRGPVISLHHLEQVEIFPGLTPAMNFPWLHAVATNDVQRVLFRRALWRFVPYNVWVDISYGYSIKLWPPSPALPVPHLHVVEETHLPLNIMPTHPSFYEYPIRKPDPQCNRLVYFRHLPTTPDSSVFYVHPESLDCTALARQLQSLFSVLPRVISLSLGTCSGMEPLCDGKLEAEQLTFTVDPSHFRAVGWRRKK
eukprot:TRINITY_DN22270_c0_g1_i1.p2 TRINITY_DN22270_c0_g1~~TRINITY_DN22270_c0_g1_i1.p2  ORF type:complete len:211 (+),score=22.35 TRINITY_DN22270_c0_g1_i1:895-1527(+)